MMTALSLVLQLAFVTLYDRDAESWAGHRYGEQLLLNAQTTPLVMTLTSPQRFNPAVKAERLSLSNVGLWVTLPPSFEPQAKLDVWVRQGQNTYSTRLGLINAGERINAAEVLSLLASQRGTFVVFYTITARELPGPVRGSFTVEVR